MNRVNDKRDVNDEQLQDKMTEMIELSVAQSINTDTKTLETDKTTN